ncbi:MAG: efflux transporter outer membrane subunit [Desulfovibrionaceae bacterium]
MNVLQRISRPALLAALVALCAVLAAGGCSPFAPAPRDAAPASLPGGYVLYDEWPRDAAPSADRWWTQLGGQELDGLMRKALSDDFSIRQAWAKLSQARAEAVQAGASLTPSLSASGDAAHTRSWSKERQGKETFSLGEQFELGLSASYELDLWGRVRATAEAGNLDAAASRQDLETAAATVAESVAKAWIDLLATRAQLTLLHAQVATNKDILRVQELLLLSTQASALDILEQQENLASVEAQRPDLVTAERTLLNQLAILTGRAPGTLEIPLGGMLPDLSAPPATGLPADMLAKRPDVRSTGLSLRAADWQIAAARADRLPAITLTGSGSYSGTGLSTVFDAWALKLAAGLVMPILDGGNRAAEVDRLRAVAEERLAAYEQTVLTAVREVEDALATEQGQRSLLAALATQLGLARKAEAEARRRYLNGVDDTFLPYLTAITAVQSLEMSMIQERADLLKNRVALYVALGGGWTSDLTPGGLPSQDPASPANTPVNNDPDTIDMTRSAS